MVVTREQQRKNIMKNVKKKNVLVELFLILENDELLPDNIDCYEIARRIIKN